MAITNTGIVERVITGVNESDLFLDSEATSTVNNTGIVERSVVGVNTSETPFWRPTESNSVVNNTGIVERPISGVNESDPMFPNNTISNIVNLAGNLLIALINAFKSRVSSDGGTLDNEVGLNIDDLDDTSTLTMLPNAYKDGTLYSVLPEDASGDFDVVRGSSATRVNSLGLIELITDTNTPRIDYTSGSPVLLVEEQSTNLFRDSTILDSNGSGVVTANAAISPDGTQNASLVDFATGANDGGRLKIGGSTATPSTDYVISFYAKNIVGDGTFKLRIDTDTQSVLVDTNFTATSEWARYTHTFTTDAASSSFGSSSRLRKGTDNNEILFYGMQLEVGPPATSYIETIGNIATRLADSITVDTTSLSLTSITETIDGVEQTPITIIPSTYTIPQGNINKIVMI